jgi:cbb3-type cytochrome oxidase cytochrome c subunit
VPYRAEDIARAAEDARAQGEAIAKNLRQDGVADVDPAAEIVALTAYLQRLGVHPGPESPLNVASTGKH